MEKSIIRARTCLLAAVLAALALAPTARAAVKAALVEEVIPPHPFFDSMNIAGASPRAVGPGGGTLGVTSITLVNYDTYVQSVFLFQPTLTGTACTSAIVGGGLPHMQVFVQPLSTLHLTFPTPMVFGTVSSCIGAEVTTTLHGGSVEIDVNGVLN